MTQVVKRQVIVMEWTPPSQRRQRCAKLELCPREGDRAPGSAGSARCGVETSP